MPKKIKILIVCGETLSCLAFRGLMSKEKDFVIVKIVSNTGDTVRWLQKTNPDIFLLCAHLLIEKGSDIIAKIMEKTKGTRIVVFNSHFTQDQELLLVREGVVGILSANLEPPTLLKALRKVHSGELWFRRGLIPSLIGEPRLESQGLKVSAGGNPILTERELEVLSLLANDYKNREISYKLCISESTVKTHVHNIFKKLKVNNRLQAIFYARRHFLHSKYLQI
jgi:DNA-binding NarL/FixJ family response regulator